MMIILRALLDIVVFIVLIPIKVVILMAAFIWCIYYSRKFDEPLSEWVGYVSTGFRQGIEQEIRWIKTGKIY